MGFLKGKRALIVGLATDRSIAWGIAQAMHREGAELAFSHIERMADRVVPLAKSLGSEITFPMDVASDEDIERGFAHLKTRWEAFDILVHAVAFAPREALSGTFIEATTREGFRVAHDISSYSLTALAKASLPFMTGRAGAMLAPR
jgi:enoyl-[acyl-carrier protein] reductase I